MAQSMCSILAVLLAVHTMCRAVRPTHAADRELLDNAEQFISSLDLWARGLEYETSFYKDSFHAGEPTSKLYGTLKDPQQPWGGVDWSPERQQLHNTLVELAMADIMSVAESMKDHVPGIYCLRGNTAAGKSMAIKTNMIPELHALAEPPIKDMQYKAINPDAFKVPLIEQGKKDGKTFSHMDVHLESSSLAELVLQRAYEAKVVNTAGATVPASFVIDQRLAWQPQITEGFIPQAAATGRKVFMYDIDSPLKFSLLGVLQRPRGGDDPIPPFGAIAYGGFLPIKKNRDELIQLYEENKPMMGEYTLFDTLPNFGKRLVVKITGGHKGIENDLAYSGLVGSQQKVEEEVAAVSAEVIDAENIDGVCGGLDGEFANKCKKTLCGWIGNTWEGAVNGWAGAMDPDESKCGYLGSATQLESTLQQG